MQTLTYNGTEQATVSIPITSGATVVTPMNLGGNRGFITAYIENNQLIIAPMQFLSAMDNGVYSYILNLENDVGEVVETVDVTMQVDVPAETIFKTVVVNNIAIDFMMPYMNFDYDNMTEEVVTTGPEIVSRAYIDGGLYIEFNSNVPDGVYYYTLNLKNDAGVIVKTIDLTIVVAQLATSTLSEYNRTDLTTAEYRISLNSIDAETIEFSGVANAVISNVYVDNNEAVVQFNANSSFSDNDYYEYHMYVYNANDELVEVIQFNLLVSLPNTVITYDSQALTHIIPTATIMDDTFLVEGQTGSDYIVNRIYVEGGRLKVDLQPDVTASNNGIYSYYVNLYNNEGYVETVQVKVDVQLGDTTLNSQQWIDYTNSSAYWSPISIETNLDSSLSYKIEGIVEGSDPIINRVFIDGGVTAEFQSGLTSAQNGTYTYQLQLLESGTLVETIELTVYVNIPSEDVPPPPQPTNTPPVGNNGEYSMVVGESLSLLASQLVTDAESDTLSFVGTPSSTDANITATMNSDVLEIQAFGAGSTNISVDITDGTNTVTVTFLVIATTP